MKKLSLNAKSFVAGMLLMALLTPLIVVGSEVVTRQIHYGVNVVINGQTLQLDGIDRPFIMDGRTFLPVRGIADALGVPADWDGATSTVFLGDRFAGQRQPLRQAAPFFDRLPNSDSGIHFVNFLDSVNMGGITYNDALTFRRGNFNSGTHFSLHNLNGQFRVFSGYVGRIDGSSMFDVTVNIIGDGNVIQSHEIRAADMPISFSAFVEGVQQLRIEVVTSITNLGTGSAFMHHAIVGYLE